jgi:hypothetical protein
MLIDVLVSLLAEREQATPVARLCRLHGRYPLRVARRLRPRTRPVATLMSRHPESDIGGSRLLRGVARTIQRDEHDELVARLRVAVHANGMETALRLAEEVVGSSQKERLDTTALELASHAFMSAGRHHEAHELWARNVTAAQADNPTWLALRALCEERRYPWQHLDRVHPFVVDLGLARGHLAPDAVLSLLAGKTSHFVFNPECYLLQHNAEQAARHDGSPALSRYLEACGVRERSPARSRRLVSVVMAARNAEATVVAAARSILAQTHENLELLICDDASDDATLELLRSQVASDPRVRLFRSHDGQGTYNIRNQLFAAARGELLTTQDADDVALPSRLADQLQAMATLRADACVSSWLRMRPNGSAVFHWDGRAARLAVVSLLVERRVAAQMGPFRSARYGADLEYLEQLRRSRFRIARVHRPLILAGWSDGSLTRSNAAESLENGFRSAGRRAYAEVVYQRQLLGPEAIPDAVVEDLLRQHDNHVAPAGIDEVR